jgi:hypothetical protein
MRGQPETLALSAILAARDTCVQAERDQRIAELTQQISELHGEATSAQDLIREFTETALRNQRDLAALLDRIQVAVRSALPGDHHPVRVGLLDGGVMAAIDTARFEGRKETLEHMLREFSHWTPWGTREAVCDRIRSLAAQPPAPEVADAK